MRTIILTTAACAAVLALSSVAMAQSEVTPVTPGNTPNSTGKGTNSDLKGPPNANGYGKDTGRSSTSEPGGTTPSATNMKGPPNANGYQKK